MGIFRQPPPRGCVLKLNETADINGDDGCSRLRAAVC